MLLLLSYFNCKIMTLWSHYYCNIIDSNLFFIDFPEMGSLVMSSFVLSDFHHSPLFCEHGPSSGLGCSTWMDASLWDSWCCLGKVCHWGLLRTTLGLQALWLGMRGWRWDCFDSNRTPQREFVKSLLCVVRFPWMLLTVSFGQFSTSQKDAPLTCKQNRKGWTLTLSPLALQPLCVLVLCHGQEARTAFAGSQIPPIPTNELL